MRSEPEIVTALAARAGLLHFFVEVEGTDYPPTPYLLFSDSLSSPRELDPDLQHTESVETLLYVTVVDSTAGNVHSTRTLVRELLTPGGYSVNVAGYRVKRIPGEFIGIQVDAETPRDAYGRRPYFAVDVYRLVRE